jgi:signal transduction histidine kinase
MSSASFPNPSDYHFASIPDLGDGPTRRYYENLFRGLAHKLNNQTSVVHGFSSLLLMQDNLDSGVRDNLSHMKEASNQMSALMSRVLLLAGCGRPAPQRVQFAEFLARMDRPMRELMYGLGVPFTANIAKDLPAIQADPSLLRELLMELLRNAAEAATAAGNGQVAFDTFAPGQASPIGTPHVDMFIRNSGQTIPPGKIATAVEPFHGTKGSDHFGLGLTTAAMITRNLGGKLGIRSHQGTTTVWLALPALP